MNNRRKLVIAFGGLCLQRRLVLSLSKNESFRMVFMGVESASALATRLEALRADCVTSVT